MTFYGITGLFNALTAFVVGTLVFWKHEGDVRRITFTRFALSIAVWSIFYFFWQLANSEAAAAWLARILFVGCYFIPSCFFHHVVTLTGEHRKLGKNRLIRLGYLASFLFLILFPTRLVIQGVIAKPFFPYWPHKGILFDFYTAFFFFFVGYGNWILYLAYRKSSTRSRRQFGILLLGSTIAFLGGATNFFLLYDIPIPPFGNVIVPLFMLITSYSIMRYKFMDIQVVITRTGILAAIYGVVLGVPFLLGSFGRPPLMEWFGVSWWLVPLILCTILATIGPFAYAYLRRQAEARLLKEQRRYQRTLQLASRGMTQVRNVDRLSNLITRLVSRTVGMTHASLFLWDETHQSYVLRASHGPKRLSLQSRYALEASHPLIRWLVEHRRPLTADDAVQHPDRTLRSELEALESMLVIPGLMEHRLTGFLALGPKRSGAWYSSDDLHAFSTLANEASVAIENAGSYEELLKVNEQLKAASERLLRQERLAAAGQFAAGMAHEIKNPLSAIKTFAQYLPEKYMDPAFREKFFRIVQEEIDRINTIIQELSDFARPAPLQLKSVRLSELLDDTLSLLSNQCLKQGIEIRNSSNDNGLVIHADPQQLKQVLLNLLLNGMEAMEGGGRLEVATQLKGDQAVLRVSDTGAGIAPEYLSQVWDPFFTTKERGMGLGMAIVKGVVERHGGSIHLSSTLGKGTTVEVSFPVRPPAS